MARTFGKIFASMWDDEDFLSSLGPDAKYLYNFLIPQPDLAHSGVIVVRTAPWARRMGISAERVDAALDELHTARYIVLDRDEMLLLVRSLIRRDAVYKQPNVFKSAAEQIYSVSSKPIRAALADELERLGEEPMNGETRQLCMELVAWLRKASGNPSRNPPEEGSGNPSEGHSAQNDQDGQATDITAGDEGSDNPSGNPSPRARVHAGVPLPLPLSPDPFPEPLPISPPPASETATEPPPKFTDFWSAYPKSVGKGAARTAWDKAIKRGAEPFVVLGAAVIYADLCRVTGKERQYIPNPATWLNQERYDDPPETAQVPPPRSPPGGHQPYRNTLTDADYDEGFR